MRKLLTGIALYIILLSAFAGEAFAEQQTISLKQGFNFISFTISPDATPSALKQQNAAIGEIYTYSAAAGSFLSTMDGSLTALSAGKGYIIYAASAASITVSGTAITSAGNISLKAGFNLIGVSKSVNSLKFSQIILNNSSVRGVYKWSAASGSFIQVLKGSSGGVYQLDGIDPAIAAGESYFMYVDSAATLNYDNGYFSFNSATAADDEAIRTLFSQYVSGIKARNISAIMALYSENYLHVNEDGQETKADRQAMISGMSYSSAEGTDWKLLSVKISADSAMAAVYCKTVLDGKVMEDQVYTDDGACFLVKENGKWLIAGNRKQWTISGFTAHFPDNYFVEVYIDDPLKKITSATISGPGVSAAGSSMIYGFYSWMPKRWAPNPMPGFGATKPSTPAVYTFTIISEGKTYTETLDLGNNFIDEAASPTSPAAGATVSSKPTFTWSPVSLSGAVYNVEIVDQNYNNIWNGEGASSATSSTYTGTLSPGNYKWCVVTKIQGSENRSFSSYREFTVQ